MFSRLVPRHAELVAKLALRSDLPVVDLNVRAGRLRQLALRSDLPLVDLNVRAGRLRQLAVRDSMFSRLVPRDAELVAKLAEKFV